MRHDRHTIGSLAERKACDYLQNQGLKLLKKNFRCRFGEIDLIMQEQKDIVFVEVRSRKKADFGNAKESITAIKRQKLIRTASFYLQEKQLTNEIGTRFDIISLQWEKSGWQLEWIRNAFTG